MTGGALYSVDLKTGKATMVGKIEGLSGNGDRHRLDRLISNRSSSTRPAGILPRAGCFCRGTIT